MSDPDDERGEAAPEANGTKVHLVRTGGQGGSGGEATSEQLSATELTAFRCFAGLGFAPSPAAIGRSILARIKEKGHLAEVEYTPDYFVEEIIFAIALSIEAEQRYGFITRLIELTREEARDEPDPTLPEVIACMSAMAHGIARGRMVCARLADQMPSAKFWSRFEEGMGDYCDLLKSSLGRRDLLPGKPLMASPAADDQGHSAYLGSVGDNLAEALGIPKGDRDNRVLLKSFLVTVWNAVMAEVAEAAKSHHSPRGT